MTKSSPHTPPPFKKFLKQISLALTGFAIVTGTLFYSTTVSSQESTSPAIPDEEIKENIKDRLEKAIKDQETTIQLKRAWVGTLESIANHTLTIETRDGPKLASISAESDFVRLPKRTKITAEDLKIGSFTIVMGYLDGNQVLNARRVVIQEEAPETPSRQAHFVISFEYDKDDDSITANLTSGETQEFELNKNTEITIGENSEIEEAEIDDLENAQRAIIIIKIEDEEEEITTTLLRIHILPLLEEDINPEPSLSDESEENQATESSESAGENEKTPSAPLDE